jgi:RNA polymerase sigma-70 factor (ECF subfamily)
MESDERLLGLARDGCEASWTALYQRHRGRIQRFALHMCGSAEVAGEAVQETFLALLDRMDRYDAGKGSLGSWLLGVARNKVLRLLEGERRHEAIESEDHAHAANALTDLTANESIEAVRRAVLALPANYREVTVLCGLEETGYEEAARILGCPVGTVRSRLHRARRLLMDRLIPVEKGGCVK